jgi:hypothetical protein
MTTISLMMPQTAAVERADRASQPTAHDKVRELGMSALATRGAVMCLAGMGLLAVKH